ncbi:MAG: hypothetical protein K940chlam8_00247 [Chlamydiae bacterium]|nr:hypothetical protein [Chlamydiota bacterium]
MKTLKCQFFRQKLPFFLLELVVAFFLFTLTVSGIFSWQMSLKQKEAQLLKDYALEYAIEEAKFFLAEFLNDKVVKQAISKKDTEIFVKKDTIRTPFFESADCVRTISIKHTCEPRKQENKLAYLLTATVKADLLGRSKSRKIRTIVFQ